MLKHLVDHFLARPKRLVALGQVLTRFGGFLVVLGVIAHAATKSLPVFRGMAGVHQTDRTLANLLPAVSTWWVPAGPSASASPRLLYWPAWWRCTPVACTSACCATDAQWTRTA